MPVSRSVAETWIAMLNQTQTVAQADNQHCHVTLREKCACAVGEDAQTSHRFRFYHCFVFFIRSCSVCLCTTPAPASILPVDRTNQLQTLVISAISTEPCGITTSSIFSYPTSLRSDGRHRQLPPYFLFHFEHVAFLPDRLLCFYVSDVAASIARIAVRWVIKPFWVCPYHNAVLSHGDALPLARDIPTVTPKIGKEYRVLSHLPRRLTHSDWARRIHER